MFQIDFSDESVVVIKGRLDAAQAPDDAGRVDERALAYRGIGADEQREIRVV